MLRLKNWARKRKRGWGFEKPARKDSDKSGAGRVMVRTAIKPILLRDAEQGAKVGDEEVNRPEEDADNYQAAKG